MTELEKSYIAGIIDSEGSIILQEFQSNEHPYPCISIASTTYELLNWIKSVIGKGTIKQNKNCTSFKYKDCYSYVLKYDDAIQLIKEIYPYLIINAKRRRSELILNNYKAPTPRKGRYSDKILKSKLNFYDEFISIK